MYLIVNEQSLVKTSFVDINDLEEASLLYSSSIGYNINRVLSDFDEIESCTTTDGIYIFVYLPTCDIVNINDGIITVLNKFHIIKTYVNTNGIPMLHKPELTDKPVQLHEQIQKLREFCRQAKVKKLSKYIISIAVDKLISLTKEIAQ